MPRSCTATTEESTDSFLDFLKTSRNADRIFYENKEIEGDIRTLLDEPVADDAKNAGAKKPLSTPQNLSKPASRNGITAYYGRIAQYAPFSREEEERIFRHYNTVKKKLKKLRKSDKEARSLEKELLDTRNKIVERNLRFVVKLARSFWMDGNPENFENLVSSGNIGLIRAVDRFDTKRGTRFLSYAAHWIALEIRGELANASLVKVPVWWQKTLRKLNDAYKQLSISMEHVTADVLAKKSAVPVKLVSKVSDGRGRVIEEALPSTRMEVAFTEGEHCNISKEDVEDELFLNNARECIEELLTEVHKDCEEKGASKFNKSDAVRSVFGLTALGPQNLRQISNVTNVCSERVRQLKEEGLVSLRKKMRNHKRFSKVERVSDIL